MNNVFKKIMGYAAVAWLMFASGGVYGQEQFKLDIVFDSIPIVFDEEMDTMFANFKFKWNDDIVNVGDLSQYNIEFSETDVHAGSGKVSDNISLESSNSYLSSKLSIVVLADKSVSISDEAMEKQRRILRYLFNLCEDVNLRFYVSAMDDMVTMTKEMTTMDELNRWIVSNLSVQSEADKYLYEAMASKIEEISGLSHECYQSVPHNTSLRDDSDKIFVVMTDGKVKNADSTFIGGKDFFKMKSFFVSRFNSRIKNGELTNLPTYFIYVGDEEHADEAEQELSIISDMSNNDDFRDEYFVKNYDFASLERQAKDILGGLHTSYKITFRNDPGKVFGGQELTLRLLVKSDVGTAEGSTRYVKGSRMKPFVVVPDLRPWQTALYGWIGGAIAAFVLILLLYFILQFVFPRIKYRRFLKRHVKCYDHDTPDVSEQCCYCKQKFYLGDKIVTKCKHTVHWECWEENRDRCPEYGNGCEDGFYYYNRDNLRDSRNTTPKLKWMMLGMISAFVVWCLHQAIPNEKVASNFFEWFVRMVKYGFGNNQSSDAAHTLLNMRIKLQEIVLIGMQFGFIVTLVFRYHLYTDQHNARGMLKNIALSIVNMCICGIAALIGSAFFILMGKDYNCFWTDFLPWLLFGFALMWLIVPKTDSCLRTAIFASVLSVIVGYVYLYMIPFKGNLGLFSYLNSVVSMMIIGVGFGLGVAVKPRFSNKFFLHVGESVKGQDIAIYKWMMSSGGFRKVSIGRDFHCMIDMRWDNSDGIDGKQVELYLKNDLPYCRILAPGVKTGTDYISKTREINEEIRLDNGMVIRIGKTTFSYFEKDR